MKPSSILTLAFALGLAVFGAGCTASSQLDEETEAPAAPVEKPVEPAPAAVKTPAPAQTNKQGFTTKEDTIEVESAQRNHRPEHPPMIVPRRAPAASFRVQIGAFKEEANAQRATGVLAKRYHKPAAFYFDSADKLYKVTVGNFATEKEAKRFAAAMRKKYPKEYKTVWVVRRAE